MHVQQSLSFDTAHCGHVVGSDLCGGRAVADGEAAGDGGVAVGVDVGQQLPQLEVVVVQELSRFFFRVAPVSFTPGRDRQVRLVWQVGRLVAW